MGDARGGWKYWREALVVVVILAVLVVILYPVIGNLGGSSASEAHCMSNLKRLSQVLGQYVVDNGACPPPDSDWQASTIRYAESDSIYHCSVLERNWREDYGYALNKGIAGKNPNKVSEPSKVPLVFESDLLGKSSWSKPDKLAAEPRHAGGNNVAFCDGHVKRVRRILK